MKSIIGTKLFRLISLLNSIKQINPNTKNKAIRALRYGSEIKKSAMYKAPEIALVASSFMNYRSSNSNKYKFFVLLP